MHLNRTGAVVNPADAISPATLLRSAPGNTPVVALGVATGTLQNPATITGGTKLGMNLQNIQLHSEEHTS